MNPTNGVRSETGSASRSIFIEKYKMLGVGLTTLSCKKKVIEKPPRNSAGFCGGGQGLSWAVEPRKEEYKI
jgi:hypothetical protein